MPTPQEKRKTRIGNDYIEMQNIQGPIVQWHPIRGQPPYVEVYELTINVRTIIGTGPDYRDTHVIRVMLPQNYPNVIPETIMQTNPPPFHPNWFSDGRWCGGTWDISEGLGHHVIRMIRTLQFDSIITNPDSSANKPAMNWYMENRNRGWFPCDRQILPDPIKSRFEIASGKKTFRIEKIE
jgi:ubiquitin-protein ligase